MGFSAHREESELPPVETIIIFLAATGIVSYALYKSKKFMVLYAIASIGLAVFNPLLYILLIIVSILVIAKRYVHKDMNILAMLAGGVLLLLLLVGSIYRIFLPLAGRDIQPDDKQHGY